MTPTRAESTFSRVRTILPVSRSRVCKVSSISSARRIGASQKSTKARQSDRGNDTASVRAPVVRSRNAPMRKYFRDELVGNSSKQASSPQPSPPEEERGMFSSQGSKFKARNYNFQPLR